MERETLIRLVTWLLFFALPAAAQGIPAFYELPAFYRVTGVAYNDVLNIRAGPSASTKILDILAPDATDIEVTGLSEDGKWAQVNVYEQAGWAALAYLTRQPQPATDAAPLQCFGTEPFWSLDVAENLTLQTIEDGGFDYPVQRSSRSTNRFGRFAKSGGDQGGEAIAVIEHRKCNDGMSDAEFGLTLDLVVIENTQQYMLSGCCRLIP